MAVVVFGRHFGWSRRTRTLIEGFYCGFRSYNVLSERTVVVLGQTTTRCELILCYFRLDLGRGSGQTSMLTHGHTQIAISVFIIESTNIIFSMLRDPTNFQKKLKSKNIRFGVYFRKFSLDSKKKKIF